MTPWSTGVCAANSVELRYLRTGGARPPVVLQALNPQVRVAQIADAGHGLPFDQPARLSEAVAGLLRALG